MRLSEVFLLRAPSLPVLLEISKYLMISYLPIILPFSFLISILLGIGRLSANGEIGAIRSIGISFYHFSFPILLSGLAVSIFSLLLNLYLAPWGNRMVRYELLNLNKLVKASNVKEGKFNFLFSDKTSLYAKQLSSDNTELYGVFIHHNSDGTAFNVMANKGKFVEYTMQKKGLPSVIIRLWDGVMHRMNTKKESQDLIVFERYDILFRSSMVGMGYAEKPKTMDQQVLKKKIQVAKELGNASEFLPLLVEYWKRISLSWSNLVFVVLGVSLGMLQINALHSRAFVLALLIALIYWICYSAGLYLGEKGIVPPALAMWMGNILLFCIALLFIRIAPK